MEITKEEIKKLAELSRIKITEKEAEQYKKEAQEIVGFFDEIKGAEVGSSTPTLPIGVREGIEEAENTSETIRDEERIDRGTDKESEQFREREDGYLKIPKVF